MNKTKVRIFTILGLSIFICFSIYLSFYLFSFIKDPDTFRKWIDSFGVLAPFAYIFITMLQILVPIIPGEPVEIVAGYAFEAIPGTIYCVIGESIASLTILYLVKKYGRNLVELFFEKEKIDSLSFLHSSKNRILLFACIFIMPGTPKDLFTYFIGLTDINMKYILIITTLGRIPSIITSTLSGHFLGSKQYHFTFIVTAITAFLSLCGILFYSYSIKQQKDR